MRAVIVLVSLMIMGISQVEASSRCSKILEEYQAMQNAHQSVMQGLIANHELMAGQLEDVTMELDMYSSELSSKSTLSMKKSAKAYRARAKNSRQIALKLDAATTDLGRRLRDCLR